MAPALLLQKGLKAIVEPEETLQKGNDEEVGLLHAACGDCDSDAA